MASRSLTEVFVLLRNNAAHRRLLLHEQELDEIAEDRMALVPGIGSDADAAIGAVKRVPPDWIDSMDEVHFDVIRIKSKLRELAVLHDKHLNRPTLDDVSTEEHTIEISTQEITQMFHRCQRAVQSLQRQGGGRGMNDQVLANVKPISTSGIRRFVVINGVISTLASIGFSTLSFDEREWGPPRGMKSREERSEGFFEMGGLLEQAELDELYDKCFSEQQLLMVEHNSLLVTEREREIRHVLQSIFELNEIFRDLADMIVEQGTVLDRIDFNMEQTCVKTQEGIKQLQKAEKYQKKNRKMLFILLLVIIIVVLVVTLIGIKSK
uniref:syntaxin-16 isoform X1 n=1 Tax=Myxine glutinosa TaxID=7769 RepID=UPI00358FACA7